MVIVIAKILAVVGYGAECLLGLWVCCYGFRIAKGLKEDGHRGEAFMVCVGLFLLLVAMIALGIWLTRELSKI